MVISRRLSGTVTRSAAAGIMVGTASMMVVLSAFNGLENLIRKNYDIVHPHVSILPLEGTDLAWDEALDALLTHPDIADFEPVLEQQALLKHGEQEALVTLVAVQRSFVTPHAGTGRWTDSLLTANPDHWGSRSALVGRGVAMKMGINSYGLGSIVQAMWPESNQDMSRQALQIDGIFFAHPQVDEYVVLIPLASLQQWTGHELSQVKVWLKSGADMKAFRLAASDYLCKEPKDWERTLFNVLKSERLVTITILAFIVLLASLGLYAATSLMALERKRETATLVAMGMPLTRVKAAYTWGGLWMSILGGGFGLLMGRAIIAGQSTFGWLSLGQGYIVDAYPVAWSWTFAWLTWGFVVLVGTLLAWLAAQRIRPQTELLR